MPKHKQALTTFGHMTPAGRLSTESLSLWGAVGRGYRRHDGDPVLTEPGMPLLIARERPPPHGSLGEGRELKREAAA